MISSIAHIARLARAGYVFAREGVLGLVDPGPLSPAARLGLRLVRIIERPIDAQAHDKLAKALTRLGPTYVKLGQFLATRPDIVGTEMARALETLQDKLPPFAQPEAEKALAFTLDKPVSELFASFALPVAAASIAQVHPADIIQDGVRRKVAVKILRPDIRYRFAQDIAAMNFAARLGERMMPDLRRLKPVEGVADFARTVTIETDLRLEAAALSELAENTKNDPGVRIPTVLWEMTGRDVLTTEWVDGISLSNLDALREAGHDLPELAKILMQTFLRLALRDGFFHADMHPGNLFTDRDGHLVMVDCGIMGRLGAKERRFLAEILYGFIARDYRRVAEVHFEAGYVPAHHSVENFTQAIRAIGEPIHNRPAREISMAKLLTLLFDVTAIFDMKTRIELVLLQKTMIVVEGVARRLDPDFDMWKSSDPVVREWIERHLGPVGKLSDTAHGAGEMLKLIGGIPVMAERARALASRFDDLTREGLVLAPETVEAISRAVARRSRLRTLALWIILALLAVLVWQISALI